MTSKEVEDMYNYANLSDVDFEILCKDIMEKKLGIELHIFAKGRDGGIDITDDTKQKNIVIQVKHYIKSTYASLKNSLREEIEKVKKLNPKQYYVCCAQNLTANNINEIYDMFSDYMMGSCNVISLNEIDEFLKKEENAEVLRRNYKLWLESTNILSEINNQDIFIDCESLLFHIEKERQKFVETRYYQQCIDILTHDRAVILLGNPGVGKTMTTKMIALYYAANGYRIRYSTNGEISAIKKSLSVDKERKEIIILDDCLGQHYFNMKETQENELLALIKYVLMNRNKMIILNSRITIYNEATERTIEFKYFMEEGQTEVKILDIGKISINDKGKIFYNHIYFEGLLKEHYKSILENSNYRKIVLHKNYTPRLVEYITKKCNYKDIEPNKYYQFITQCLENPKIIWQDEFIRRLEQQDRILLITLYSLTDTLINIEVLERAYNHRIKSIAGLDTTMNIFELSLKRLSGSMISIIDRYGKKVVGVINPSINDFLKSHLQENKNELMNVRKYCTEYIQIKRFFQEGIIDIVRSGEAEEYNYTSSIQKDAVILTNICKYNILDSNYQENIDNYLEGAMDYYEDDLYSRSEIINILLTGEFNDFYNTADKAENGSLEYLFEEMDIDGYEEFLEKIYSYHNMWLLELYKDVISDNIVRAIDDYCTQIDCSDYYEECDITTSTNGENLEEMAKNAIYIVQGKIEEKILEKLSGYSEDIKIPITINRSSIPVEWEDIKSYLEDYFGEDRGGYTGNRSTDSEIDMLDYIFK